MNATTMMMSPPPPKRHSIDYASGSSLPFNHVLGNAAKGNGINGTTNHSGQSPSRHRAASTITFIDAVGARTHDDDTRIPYRDRKLSESVVSLTGVVEEEETSSPSSPVVDRPRENGYEEAHYGFARQAHASPMARSSSQRRISQEINSRAGIAIGAGAGVARPGSVAMNAAMRPSNSGGGSSSGELTDEGRSSIYATPARQAPARRNSGRTSSNGIVPLRMPPVRSMSVGGGSEMERDDSDYFGSEVIHDGEISPTTHARVPFPRSFSSSYANASDSPSARRIGRHLSLSAAQSTDSVNDIPTSPRFGPARVTNVQGRHIRYTSDLHIARPNFTTSQSEASFDTRSRSRRSSEWGSMYANTLDDSATQSGVKVGRNASTASVKPSKHRLILTEEGKTDVILQLGNCIGRGQFGSVYRALNLNTGQMVAVKRIKLHNRSEDEVTQLMHEVELLKSLVHPSVVKYEGLSRGEDVVSIVLEYVENGSLLHTLKAFGNFPEKLVASYVVKMLEGLNYLHEMKVVHCDLKAANILTTKNGNVKLSDFGVSLNLKAAEELKKNDAVGTPNWMAPEVIELKGASTAADIWSLACTIIELLTGKPPYGDMLAMSAMWRIVEDDCPPLPDSISEHLRDFLKQCFQKDPLLRPNAAMLFEHAWLRNTWTDHKALRPQDSVPFFKRIASSDSKKDSLRKTNSVKKSVGRARQQTVTQADVTLPSLVHDDSSAELGQLPMQDMKRSSSSPPVPLSLRPDLIAMRASSAPDAWSAKPIKENETESGPEDSRTNTPLFSPAGVSASLSVSPPTLLSFDIANRRGSDVTSTSTSLDILRSPNILAANVEKERLALEGVSMDASMTDLNASDVFLLDEQTQNKAHAFVKSTFGKAVQCKICRDAVRKHAVLCEDCGLICHASCARRASIPCNLRAQLLMLASNQRSSTDVVRVMSPTPSTSTPPPPTPTMAASPPIFRFPFGKYKRNSKGASDLNLPASLGTSPHAAVLESDGKENVRPKSPPLTPCTPTMVTPTPVDDKENEKKRQRRSRRISLLPSHLMRQRSPSPAAELASRTTLDESAAAVATAIAVRGHEEARVSAASSTDMRVLVRSPSSTPSQQDETSMAYGSNASSISGSFQLGSPTSQVSSTGRSVFPSIEGRNQQQAYKSSALMSTPTQQNAGHIKLQDPPRKQNARRQRFLSTGATPLSIGSTPNLLAHTRGSGGAGAGGGVGLKQASDGRPDLPLRQASQGMPWRRAQFAASGRVDGGHHDDRDEGNHLESTHLHHQGQFERKHMRRISTKQDCVIA